MNQPAGPWALVRHMWTQNFHANPVGTVLGSVLAVGALAFMLFFGFFVVVALVVMGALFLLAQTLFGGAARPGPRRGAASGRSQSGIDDSINNNAIEGEYKVVSEKKSETS